MKFHYMPRLSGSTVGALSGKRLPYRGVTTLVLNGKVMGVAYCSTKDEYSKSKGKREATRDALENIKPNTPEELAFWNDFLGGKK